MSIPKNKTDFKSNAEIRSMAEFEISKAEENEKSYIVEGYAAKYEPYVLFYDDAGEPVYEKFSRENFANAECSDCLFQLNHGGMVFARQKNGTLQLSIDDVGLKVRADLSKTSGAREIHEAIEAGTVSYTHLTLPTSLRV